MAFRSDIPRAAISGAALAALFAAGYLISTRLEDHSIRETALARTTPNASDDELTTGSIVFVPVLGDTCRQNLIDNRTWTVRQNGTASCKDTVSGRSPNPVGAPPTTRLEIIRESFRK